MASPCCAKNGDIVQIHVSEHLPHLTAQTAVHDVSITCIIVRKSVGLQNMAAVREGGCVKKKRNEKVMVFPSS